MWYVITDVIAHYAKNTSNVITSQRKYVTGHMTYLATRRSKAATALSGEYGHFETNSGSRNKRLWVKVCVDMQGSLILSEKQTERKCTDGQTDGRTGLEIKAQLFVEEAEITMLIFIYRHIVSHISMLHNYPRSYMLSIPTSL